MKHVRLIALMICLPFFVGCESTDMAGNRKQIGNQEAKHIAAEQQRQQESEEAGETQRNLWNAQHDILTRDGNAVAHYY